jgi:hypothetical protein
MRTPRLLSLEIVDNGRGRYNPSATTAFSE